MNSFCENPVEALKLQKVKGERIQPHLHTSSEILYMESGSASLTMGTLEYSISKGDFVFIMPGFLHCVTPSENDTSVYVINIKNEIIPEVIKRHSGLKPASPVLKAMDVPDLLKYSLTCLSTEKDKNIAYSLANLITTTIAANLRFAEVHDGATSDLSNRVLTYLSTHFREQITLETLAEAMNVSRFHLSHLFSNKLGIGFKEYLNNLRVECAKSILRSTDIPVSEIYATCGFDNQRTFNRVFRDSTGHSPRNFRIGRDEFVMPVNKPLPVDTGADFDTDISVGILPDEQAELSDTEIRVEKLNEENSVKRRKSSKTSRKSKNPTAESIVETSAETIINYPAEEASDKTPDIIRLSESTLTKESIDYSAQNNANRKRKKNDGVWLL